jgi:hypothetical protein
MSSLIGLLRSLLLTTIVSFAVPVIVVSGTLIALLGLSYLPILEKVGRIGMEQLQIFLAVFGSGCALQGIVTIGLTCAIVGALFDLFNFTVHRFRST